ncbi:MAG: LytTR family DNA-binding domain-containing protein [Casimicrobiaceae bacterium]
MTPQDLIGVPTRLGAPGGAARTLDEAPAAPGSRWLERIAVRSVGRIVIVPVAAIVRLEADDNYVRLYADRMHLHKEPLTRLLGRLDPARFLRVHRSHAINLQFVRELTRLLHGEYQIVLADGASIPSGRSYTDAIRAAFGLFY